MGKVIGCIYKYDRRNLPHSYPNTTFAIPPCSDTSIQNQRNRYSNASVGSSGSALSVLDQSTNHHGNTDGKKNDDSHSYETPLKKKLSSFFCDTITTTTTPHTWKIISMFSHFI